MQMTGNTILITGGSAGIGLAFAEWFLKAGNEVIICGRREEVPQQAKAQHPALITCACDVDKEAERVALFDWVTTQYPKVNVLVNNAGIQQRLNILTVDMKNHWSDFSKEITTNIDIKLVMIYLEKEGLK